MGIIYTSIGHGICEKYTSGFSEISCKVYWLLPILNFVIAGLLFLRFKMLFNDDDGGGGGMQHQKQSSDPGPPTYDAPTQGFQEQDSSAGGWGAGGSGPAYGGTTAVSSY